jgi:hypothetical protein
MIDLIIAGILLLIGFLIGWFSAWIAGAMKSSE